MPTILGVRPIRVVLSTIAAPADWLERARGRRRLALILLYLLLATVPASYLWRAASLAGLPDVGDPFDVALDRDRQEEIADSENAWPLFVKAATMFRPYPFPLPYGGRPGSGQACQTWVSANREALDLWREGTERPKSSHRVSGDPLPRDAELHRMVTMAEIEADRLQSEGDVAGAWTWHRAILRFGRHLNSRETVDAYIGRGGWLPRVVSPGVIRWATDPRTNAAMLRLALADAIAADASIEPISVAHRAAYLRAMREMENPSPDDVKAAEAELVGQWDDSAWYRHVPLYQRFQWFLLNEPERGRRIVRQVFANRMAFCDTPPSLRPSTTGSYWRLRLYSVTPKTPGALPPSIVERCYQGPGLAKWVLRYFDFDRFESSWEQDRAGIAGLIVTLAEELYLREHGVSPKTKQSLVGLYLERLPEAYVDYSEPTPTPLPSPPPAPVPNR